MAQVRSVVALLLLGACGPAAPPKGSSAPADDASAQPAASAAPRAPAPDANPDAPYELTQGSKRLVSTLRQLLVVEFYATRGSPALDAFVRDVTGLLRAYQDVGNGQFSFELIEPTTPARRDRAERAGIQQQDIGWLGLSFRYGDAATVIPALDSQQPVGLEFWISNKIREVRDTADGTRRRVGVLAGKREQELTEPNLVPTASGTPPSIQSIILKAFPFYAIEPVDLKDGAVEVGDHLSGLIVTQPRRRYTEKELRRIDEFLMRGGKGLVVYASAVTLEPGDASLTGKLDTHGLEPLLGGYGIQINRDVVFDLGSQFQVPISTSSGTAILRHPGIVRVAHDPAVSPLGPALDIEFPGFFLMDEVAVPFPSSLTLLRSEQPADVQIRAVARSTPDSWVETGDRVDLGLRVDLRPRSPTAPRILAAVAEGSLESALPGSSRRAAGSSRVLVVASSCFLTNPFAYATRPAPKQPRSAKARDAAPMLEQLVGPYAQRHLTNTILSFKNTLDWLTGDADLLEASRKLVAGAPRR